MSDQHRGGKHPTGPRSTHGRRDGAKQPQKQAKGGQAVKKASVVVWVGQS